MSIHPLEKSALDRVLHYARTLADLNEDVEGMKRNGLIHQMHHTTRELDGLTQAVRYYDEMVEAIQEQLTGDTNEEETSQDSE